MEMGEELELDKSINRIKYTFRWTGMNTLVEPSKRDLRQHVTYRCRYAFFFILISIDLVFSINWLAESAKNGESFTSVTYITPCVAISLLASLKSIFFIIYDKEVNEIICTLRDMEIRNRDREFSSTRNGIIKEETTFTNVFLKSLNFLTWFLLITFPLMPLCYMAIKYFKTNEVELRLPFLDLYPFDAYDIRYWPFVYFRQIISDVTVLIQISGVDFLFCICTTFIRIQFRLLKHDIEDIVPGERSHTSKLSEDPGFQDEFVRLVDWHREIIHLVDLLELIYTKSTLFNFITSSLLICLSGFNVTAVDDIPFVISFVSFLLMSLFQILTLCFFADMLMRSSTEVSDAIFNSKWYLADAAASKLLHTMQIRAQKPCKITAYGFADVNLRAFTRVLSTAWSYFALLKTLYSTPR